MFKHTAAVVALTMILFQGTGLSQQAAATAPQCRPTNEGLNGTLWVQTAAEYRMATEGAYALAKIQLDRALKDNNWTAALEQKTNYRKLPPAIILDVDETVLDNSPFQAQLIRINRPFTPEVWKQWTDLAAAEPIAGAVEFIKHARSRGVEVFYITNRSRQEEAATRKNLTQAGFPITDAPDRVLTADEQPDWQSDKSSRRAFVAKNFRVLLLIGDDLNDFASVTKLSLEERTKVAEAQRKRWGKNWIMIANPLYGSWERATYGWKRLSDTEMLMEKRSKLRGLDSIHAGVQESATAAKAK